MYTVPRLKIYFNITPTYKNFSLPAVQVDLVGVQPRLRGGGLSHDYQAAQFHFHWGSTDDRGSEHALNNKRYPMEVRLTAQTRGSGVSYNCTVKPWM